MQFQQQSQAADAQAAANAEQKRQIRLQQEQASMDAARQRSQELEQSASETNQYAMEHYKAMASMDAIVGEGAGGVSATRNFASMGIKNGQDLATLGANSTKSQSEISMQEMSAWTSGNNQIASIKAPERPSLLGAALQIGGAAIDYGNTMNKIKATTTTTKVT